MPKEDIVDLIEKFIFQVEVSFLKMLIIIDD